MKKANLLGVEITIEPRDVLLRWVSEYLGQRRSTSPLVIVTPNPEQIVLAQKFEAVRDVLNSADISLPDGVGVEWAIKTVRSSKIDDRSKKTKLLRTTDYELRTLKRIPGIEFMEELVKMAAQRNWPVAFIGGRGGTSLTSLRLLNNKYLGLKGWADEPPEIRIGSGELIVDNLDRKKYFVNLAHEIIKRKTQILFVGMGAPKQEFFLTTLRHKLLTNNYQLPIVLMSVGGAFDILSGKIARAPKFVRILNLEWLWRLIQEPWRLRRQLQLLKFFLLVLKHRFVIQSP